MKVILLGSWWILASVLGQCDDRIPRAIGPYPSQEMCRIAGEKLMPDDRQFWIPEKREKAEAQDKIDAEKRRIENERYEAEIARIGEEIRSGKRKPGTIKTSQGPADFDKDGKQILLSWSTMSSSGTFWTGPLYTALTPCVEIKDEVGKARVGE